MMQKIKGFVKRNLTIISFFMALSGFLNEIIFYIKPFEAFLTENWFYYIRFFSTIVKFSFIKDDILSFNINPLSQYKSSYFSIAFFVLFLLGVFLYKKSKNTETRLLRFSLSVVLLSSMINLLISLFLLFFFKSTLDFDFLGLMTFVFRQILTFLFLLIGFYGLKILNEGRMVQKHFPLNQYSVQANIGNGYAAFYHRMFHLLVDTLIAILVFSDLILALGGVLTGELLSFYSDNFVVYFLMAIMLFGYYMFFEMVFKATPAKFLTETQVVSTNGEKLRFKNIVIRTLLRRIPFDEFSFFGTTGWHDKFSKTNVAREKNSGIPSVKYLRIFPALLLGGILLYGFVNFQIKYAQYSNRKEVFEMKLNAIEKSIKKGFTTNHYIELTNSVYYDSDSFFSFDSNHYQKSIATVYLKVEKVTSDAVIVSKIESGDNYFYTFSQVNDYYHQSDMKFKKLRLSKDKINEMIHNDFDVYDDEESFGINLFNHEEKCFIENVVNFKEPIFELNVDGDFSLYFTNNGNTFYLVGLEGIKAPVKFDIKKPICVNKRNEVSDETIIEAIPEVYQNEPDGTFTLLLKMDLSSDTVFRYSVEIIDGKVKMKQI